MAGLRDGARGGARRAILLALLCAAAGALVLGGYLALLILQEGGAARLPLLILFGILALVLGAFWVAFTLLDQHFDDLERLRGDLLVAGGSAGNRQRLEEAPRDAGAEVQRLAAAAFGLARSSPGPGGDERAAQLNARLTAILGATAEGLVVVTDTGLVSLVNAAAQRRFDGRRIAVGTSVYAALDRDRLIEAQRQARGAAQPLRLELETVEGEPVPACLVDLGDHNGLVLCFPGAEEAFGAGTRPAPGLVHDLGLHDVVPAIAPVTGDTPLEALSALVLDCETTGLDVAEARVVSLGAVRLQGARLYPQANLDCLVRPDIPIPAASTAIHGIGDALVANAPPIAELLPRLAELVGEGAVIGHNIGYDLTVLANEAARCGSGWRAPPALDTALLMAALEPEVKSLNLEDLAERLGVEVQGRHTALGDALVTAEVFARLLPRLADRGISTFDQAQQFAAGARRLRGRQAAAGWRY